MFSSSDGVRWTTARSDEFPTVASCNGVDGSAGADSEGPGFDGVAGLQTSLRRARFPFFCAAAAAATTAASSTAACCDGVAGAGSACADGFARMMVWNSA